ncbi:MAG TPA: hypothetical protein VN599_09490 [Rudaea sp.]|nr:hypothetical protein [Rudaea sp.]
MRQALLFLLGLALGAIATANIVGALRQRDAYPRGLMNVMQHDVGTLREDARSNRCNAGTQSALDRLRDLSGSIETAVYATEPPDPPFAEYARRFRTTLPATVNCKALPQALERIGAACDACHRQYR